MLFLFRNSFSLTFERSEIKSGLLFKELSQVRTSFDSFTLVYYTDLFEYYEMRKQLALCMDYCINMDESFRNSPRETYYKHLLTQMERFESEIDTFQIDRKYIINREKRAIEWIGKFYNWAIGVMDAETARNYLDKINELGEAVNEIRQLNMNITAFAKESVLANREQFNYINNRTETIYLEFLDHKYFSANEIQNIERIGELDLISRTIWENHQYFSQLIIKHLEGAIYGKVSHLIPLDILTDDLRKLENLLPDKQKLPINIHRESALNIFKFSTTRATLYEKKILIEINIPKVDMDTYTAFEMVPIPFRSGNMNVILIPSMSHVLINHASTDYIPITKSEFEGSLLNSDGFRIAKPRNNVFHDFHENCEMNIYSNSSSHIGNLCNLKMLPKSNIFVPLNNFDKYYLHLNVPLTALEFCPRKSLQTHNFNSSGILTLSGGCKLRTKQITIRPKIPTIVSSDTIISLSPDFMNFSFSTFMERFQNDIQIQIPDDRVEQTIIQNRRDYENLIQKADNLIIKARVKSEIKPLEILRENTFYGLSIIQIILYIFIPKMILILGYIGYRCKTRSKTGTNQTIIIRK